MSDSNSKNTINDEFDQRIKALGDRIAAFANLSDKYAQLSLENEKLKKFIDEKEKNLKQEIELCKISAKVLNEKIVYLEHKNKEYESLNTEIFKSIFLIKNSLDKSLKDLNKINECTSLINENHSLLKNRQDGFDTSIVNLDKKISKVENQSASYGVQYMAIDKRVSDIAFCGLEHQKSLVALQQKQQQIVAEHSKNLESLNLQISAALNQFNHNVFQFKLEINKQIDSLKIPDISNLAKSEHVNELKHEINIASLDSKNAVSRTNNVEMQLQSLSKKMEGIQIQLKANELSQR